MIRDRRVDARRLAATEYPIRAHNLGGPIRTVNIFDQSFDAMTAFDWHKDYLNNKEVPKKFSRLLNIRDTKVVGDVKYVWEVNRCQHLSALAYASNNLEFKEHIASSVDSWILANPYLRGVNWTSSLELALRLISWALAFPLIRGQIFEATDRGQRFTKAVYLHLREMSGNLSLYSSANNHLIGEAAGLFVGATCFDWWEECSAWRWKAKEILEREIQLQVHEDGVNKEQAMSYQLFSLELFLLSMSVGLSAGNAFSERFSDRIRAMLTYLNNVATRSGDLPWFGDSDDARGFLVSPSESGLQTTMDLGGLLLQEHSFLRFSEAPTSASRALLPEGLVKTHEALKKSPAGVKMTSRFEAGGVAILRQDDDAVKLVMDFGELGYTSIAAHGHADALSVLLALDGEYLLIDPGTYAYHSHEKWRNYFRSTAAHNTLRVDGQDQSVMGGRFLWTTKAEAKLLDCRLGGEQEVVEAEHYGYNRLADPVTHRRSVVFDKGRAEFVITDLLTCAGRHEVESFFHLHQDAAVKASGPGYAEVDFRGRRVTFTVLADGFGLRVLRGTDDPIAGWRSTSFNCKQPINTLRVSGSIQGPTRIMTKIAIG